MIRDVLAPTCSLIVCHHTILDFQVSPPISVQIPEDRPSLNACSITGRSSREILLRPELSPTRLYSTPVRGRDWRKEFPHWITIWTRCKLAVPFTSLSVDNKFWFFVACYLIDTGLLFWLLHCHLFWGENHSFSFPYNRAVARKAPGTIDLNRCVALPKSILFSWHQIIIQSAGPLCSPPSSALTVQTLSKPIGSS